MGSVDFMISAPRLTFRRDAVSGAVRSRKDGLLVVGRGRRLGGLVCFDHGASPTASVKHDGGTIQWKQREQPGFQSKSGFASNEMPLAKQIKDHLTIFFSFPSSSSTASASACPRSLSFSCSCFSFPAAASGGAASASPGGLGGPLLLGFCKESGGF